MSAKDTFQLDDFNLDVIERSYQLPVLVDYWADWCGPCKYLTPIIEKLAKESNGNWELVKVDTEKYPDIAAEWGIRGIPNLKLFYKGKVIADLSGAMSEPEMRHWLHDKLPSEAKKMAFEANDLIAHGNTEEGVLLLEKAIALDKSLTDAKLVLAKLVIWDNPSYVINIVEDIKHVEEAVELIQLSEFLQLNCTNLPPCKEQELLGIAQAFLKNKQLDKAVETLIHLVSFNKAYQNELARRLIITIFHILGETNDITRTYRRAFDMALY